MREQLRALIKLSEVDAGAHDLEQQLAGIPEELQERRRAVEALDGLVGAQRQQLDEAERLFQAQEEELKQRAAMLAAAKAKSAKARTMREAEAAERELDAIRRSIKEGDAERERLSGVIENTRGVLEKPLAELKRHQEELASAEAGLEDRLAELRAQRDALTQGREVYAAKIPKPVLRRYDRIRVRINPPVVPVEKGVCTGCRISLPPQRWIEVRKGQAFYQCMNCNRFIYDPAILSEPSPLE